jgi:Zn-dependent protease with chaperone function
MELLVWAALAFFGSLLAAWAGARVALGPLRAARPQVWFERARLAFPARAVSRFALLLLPVAFAIVVMIQPFDLSMEHPLVAGLAVAVPALVAAGIVRLRVERVVRDRPFGAGEMLRGWLAFAAVLFPHVIAGAVGTIVASDRFDARTLGALAGALVVVVASFLGAGVALARLLGVARPASARLLAAVDAASAATGIRPRSVLELDLAMANAFALPASRMMLFTPDAQRALDDAGIAAIARHELGHVSEPPRVVAARLAGAMIVVGSIVVMRPIAGQVFRQDGIGAMLVSLLVIIAALLFVRLVIRPLARRMEERADGIARAHQAHDGEYARALEALYAENLTPAVMNARGTHPHLYDRLVAAGATPSWPRPAPPSRGRLRAALATCMGIAVVALTAAMMTGYRGPGVPDAAGSAASSSVVELAQ